MEIDLKKTVIKIQLRRFLSLIAFVTIIVCLLLLVPSKFEVLGINKYGLSVIFAVIYLVLAVIQNQRNLNYLYYSDQNNKLVLKYFSLSLINRKKQFFDIPQKEFIDYKINKSLLGLRQDLVMTRQFRNKEANYPPVGISALSREEKKLLIESLNKYRKK